MRLPIRWILRRALVVFLYHEVSDSPSEFNRLFNLAVCPASFSRQMDLIRRRFHVIGPRELLRGGYPRPAALITFDDGNRSYFEVALPILKSKGIPSVVFLNMGPVLGEPCWSGLVTYLQHREPRFVSRGGRRPTGNDFCRIREEEVAHYLEGEGAADFLERVRTFRGPIASEDHLREAAKEPLVTFGNHLFNHYNATLLSGRLREEYRKNQRLIEQYPNASRLVSYPFSRWSPQTTRMLLEEGAQALFIGGGLPNFQTHGPMFRRLELGEGVVTEPQMDRLLLRNPLPALVRGQLTWS